jgi:hypothetical protein
MAYNFQNRNSKIKLLTEYESVTQKADDLPAGVIDTTVACPSMSSLSLFAPQRKRAPKLPNMTEQSRHSPLDYLFRFFEWCEGFLIPIFYNYDNLPSLIHKTSLHH